MGVVLGWISEHWIEVVAALVSFTYIILSVKQIIWLWLFGILSAILYAWVYAHSGLYAGMALQAYYAIISIYGWFHWKSKQKGNDSSVGLPVVRISRRLLFTMIGIWLAVWMAVSFILSHYTDSTIPYWDGFTAAGGIVATWLLARKVLEQWLFWILIDLVSIGLYLWQGLYVTTILFCVYVVMAVLGYRDWRKTWQKAA